MCRNAISMQLMITLLKWFWSFIRNIRISPESNCSIPLMLFRKSKHLICKVMLNMLSIFFIDGATMLPVRLKIARLRANLTQEKLGVLAGIEEATARSRISQYESGIHRPTFEMMCAFARVLNVPECYFYTVDDDFAEAVLDLYVRWENKS